MKQITTRLSLIQMAVLVISFLLLGCFNDVYNIELNEIENLNIKPNEGNHGVDILIKGQLDCPVTLYLLQDGEKYIKNSLEGRVDTMFHYDWYENSLSFELDKAPDCSIKDVNVRIKMLD